MTPTLKARVRRYTQAVAVHKKAGEARSEAFAALFKAGDRIVHDRGVGRHGATVLVANAYQWSGDTLRIRSDTGREYRISAYFVVSINGVEVPRD